MAVPAPNHTIVNVHGSTTIKVKMEKQVVTSQKWARMLFAISKIRLMLFGFYFAHLHSARQGSSSLFDRMAITDKTPTDHTTKARPKMLMIMFIWLMLVHLQSIVI